VLVFVLVLDRSPNEKPGFFKKPGFWFSGPQILLTLHFACSIVKAQLHQEHRVNRKRT